LGAKRTFAKKLKSAKCPRDRHTHCSKTASSFDHLIRAASCHVGPEIPGAIALVCGALLLFGSIPGDDLQRSLPILNSLGIKRRGGGSRQSGPTAYGQTV
jgi:hypothetical protein